MDSLTQVVLGAAVGEAVLGKKVGNKAILWGAVAGTIPDLDVLSKYFVDEVSALEMHRGFSHSIVFSVIFANPFAFFIKHYERLFLSLFFVAMMAVFFLSQDTILGKSIPVLVLVALIFSAYKLKPTDQNVTTWDWTKLMFWGLITHPLLDAHTTWGTQLFWPLEYRVAYKNIFVVDPLYTLPFLVFVLLAMFQKKGSIKRKRYNNLGLIVSSSYMLLTIVFKGVTYAQFTDALEKQNIDYLEVRTRPTPLNSILWTANVETKDAYLIGMYSMLDKNNDIEFIEFKKNHDLLGKFVSEDKVKRLIKIARGWYTVEKINDNKIKYNDLRFGQTGFGKDQPFVYSFELWYDDSGNLKIKESSKTVKQGGKMLKELFNRVFGR